MADLVAPGLRRELDTLLLHLLHETSAGPFRQGHGDLLCLRIKLLSVLLPLAERVFPLKIQQAGIGVRKQITRYLTQLQRCILCLGYIRPLLGLREHVDRLWRDLRNDVADIRLFERLKSRRLESAAFNLAPADCWNCWHFDISLSTGWRADGCADRCCLLGEWRPRPASHLIGSVSL